MSCLGIQAGYAQEDEDEDAPPDMNFSAFSGDLEVEEGAKRFCSSKILGLTPQRLISVGYDYQLPYTLTTNEPTDFSNDIGVSATHGLRIATLFPIVSKNNIIFSLGFNYLESQYVLDDPAETAGDALGQSLSRSGALRSAGLAVTIFKPLNDRHFLIYSANHDLNGDYWLDELQPLSYLKHSITGIFGWRKNERKQIGFGISRTYRAGDLNYIPIIFYNYTHSSEKWGIETVFPARFHYRRSFSSRSLLRVGYELEGNSYRLQNRRQQFGPSEDIELRRSELRFQLSYEKSLSGFIWVALQAGYRYNYRYNVDDGEFFRGFFGDQEYLSENTLTNPLYFNVSLNLVSP
ncbi:MAG: DUF6268 family outer membrane beta-barrel protein [Bernardetiaceae bacterium]